MLLELSWRGGEPHLGKGGLGEEQASSCQMKEMNAGVEQNQL